MNKIFQVLHSDIDNSSNEFANCFSDLDPLLKSWNSSEKKKKNDLRGTIFLSFLWGPLEVEHLLFS